MVGAAAAAVVARAAARGWTHLEIRQIREGLGRRRGQVGLCAHHIGPVEGLRPKGERLTVIFAITYLTYLHTYQRSHLHPAPAARARPARVARSALPSRLCARPQPPSHLQNHLQTACGARQPPDLPQQRLAQELELGQLAGRAAGCRQRLPKVPGAGRGTPQPQAATLGSSEAPGRSSSRTCNTPGHLRPV